MGIVTRELSCGYRRKVILKNLNTEMPSERITCILGRSGCGKSTLLRTLLLLEPPLQGDIAFDGRDVVAFNRSERETLRSSIGVLFQNSALFNSMTLAENVAFPLRERSDIHVGLAEQIALVKLNLVGLARFAHYLPSAVSGGMRKRCGIARALALDPTYLFLDEPSAGLDPITAADLDQLILEIRDNLGTTIVVVTHELASIRTIADHIIMLEGGVALAEGSKEEVMASTKPEVRAFFQREATAKRPNEDPGLEPLLLPI